MRTRTPPLPIVGGNWKMNTNRASARSLAESVVAGCAAHTQRAEVVVFPPFPYLLHVGAVIGNSKVQLGAQDAYFEPDGAFTGEVSLAMLKDCGVSWVLTGHSERRHVLGETDALINRKTRAVLDAGLRCILCVGEKLEQREANQTDAVNEHQLRTGLRDVTPGQMARIVIAYEPVWAIGTGKTATPVDAQNAHARIRAVIKDLYGGPIAESTRIQYGGSVKGSNAAELFAQPDVDGGLIGGASLKADEFGQIVAAAAGSQAPVSARG